MTDADDATDMTEIIEPDVDGDRDIIADTNMEPLCENDKTEII